MVSDEQSGKGEVVDLYGIGSSIPVLRMLDVAKSRNFYVSFLGYSIDWEHQFSPQLADSPVYMQVSLGTSKLHLNGHAEADAPITEVRIPVKKLDQYCEALRQKIPDGDRPEVVDPRYTGTNTDMNIYDPSGNLLVFWRPDNSE